MYIEAFSVIAASAVAALVALVWATAASAQSVPVTTTSSAPVQAEAGIVCPVGTYWVPATYVHGGKWRDAHCAPRNVAR